MKIKADLHIHSNVSDGDTTPEELVDAAVKQGIRIISLTDHDRIAANTYLTDYAAALRAKGRDIRTLPGIELSTELNGRCVHILGYGAAKSAKLNCLIEQATANRNERTEKILKNLQNIGIYLDKQALSGAHRIVIAEAMVNSGYTKNIKEAMTVYLTEGGRCCAPLAPLNVRDSIETVSSSGGVAVLAHPLRSFTILQFGESLNILKDYGLTGVECFYPSHSTADIRYLVSKCKDMFVSGGSDFHSPLTNTLGSANYYLDETNYAYIAKYLE